MEISVTLYQSSEDKLSDFTHSLYLSFYLFSYLSVHLAVASILLIFSKILVLSKKSLCFVEPIAQLVFPEEQVHFIQYHPLGDLGKFQGSLINFLEKACSKSVRQTRSSCTENFRNFSKFNPWEKNKAMCHLHKYPNKPRCHVIMTSYSVSIFKILFI